MLSINKIKYLNSLSVKKYRLAEQKVLLEGFRIINEAIKTSLIFEHVWINENLKSKFVHSINKYFVCLDVCIFLLFHFIF